MKPVYNVLLSEGILSQDPDDALEVAAASAIADMLSDHPGKEYFSRASVVPAPESGKYILDLTIDPQCPSSLAIPFAVQSTWKDSYKIQTVIFRNPHRKNLHLYISDYSLGVREWQVLEDPEHRIGLIINPLDKGKISRLKLYCPQSRVTIYSMNGKTMSLSRVSIEADHLMLWDVSSAKDLKIQANVKIRVRDLAVPFLMTDPEDPIIPLISDPSRISGYPVQSLIPWLPLKCVSPGTNISFSVWESSGMVARQCLLYRSSLGSEYLDPRRADRLGTTKDGWKVALYR